MEQYFEDVVSDLSIDDMQLLGYLYDQDATANYKALQNNDVIDQCGFSESTYRRVSCRLSANKLIGIVTLKKRHSIFITSYGVAAVNKSFRLSEAN